MKSAKEILEKAMRRERGVYMNQASCQTGVAITAIREAVQEARKEALEEAATLIDCLVPDHGCPSSLLAKDVRALIDKDCKR